MGVSVLLVFFCVIRWVFVLLGFSFVFFSSCFFFFFGGGAVPRRFGGVACM